MPNLQPIESAAPAKRARPMPIQLNNYWPALVTSLLLLAACSNAPDDNSFSDCPECPAMLTIPAGNFKMGTAIVDRANDPGSGRPNANEEPLHKVSFAQSFDMGKYEITLAEYAAFVAATDYNSSQGCMLLRDGPGRLTMDPDLDWRNPGFPQADNEPVVCVSLDDALAYTAWLSDKTGHDYTIPSEAQWEYAAKARTDGRYFWGDDASQACDYANVNFSPPSGAGEDWEPPCDDGYPNIAPVGQFLPNAFGLHDTISNVWEWTTDCGHKNYDDAPTDGSAWIDDESCLFRMIRSGGVQNVLARTTHVVRAGRPKTGTAPNLGFRVVRNSGAGVMTMPGATQANTLPAHAWPVDSEGGQLFEVNCAPCHTDPSTLQGIYGTDIVSVRNLITDGGNNIMSMPAFRDRISGNDIELITVYLMQQKDWD